MSSFDGNYFMRRRVVIISLLIVLHFKVIPWGAGACLQSRDKFYTKNMHLGHIYMSDDNAETTDSTMTQKWVDLGLNCSMPTESPFIETWKLLLGCFRNCATFLRAVKAIDKAGCLLNPGFSHRRRSLPLVGLPGERGYARRLLYWTRNSTHLVQPMTPFSLALRVRNSTHLNTT